MLTRALSSAALALLLATPAAAQAPDVIHLFDGKQFTEHFYSWLVDDHLTTCPVRDECAGYALATDERYGVWGRLTAAERQQRRRRPA